MRKALLLLLLSSAAPAFAATVQRSDSEERSARIEERAERAQTERAERAERPQRPERSDPPVQFERVLREERPERSEDSRRGGFGFSDPVRGARDPSAGDDAQSPRRGPGH
jgi:hypothetical protein